MPDDPTPMAEGYYDPWARTAWLLVTSRSLGADPAYADRATFVDALNDAGVNADSSRVSRWESGQHAVSFRALRGYETVLGLPEGALVAANRQLVRDCEASAKPPEKVSFAGHEHRSPDVMVSDLVDRATDKDDHLTGGDWLRLATELERFELVLLSNRTWSLVCERLVHELARTTGVDQLRRFEALSTLVTHPVAQRHVLLALGAWLTDPDVQVVFPMLTVLQQLEDPAASKLVCRLLDAPSGQLSRGAIQVAAAKLARGHIGPAHLALIEQHAIRGLVTPTSKRSADLLDLLTHLPADSFARVTGTLKDGPLRARILQTRETHDLAVREASRSISRQVSAQAQAMTPAVYRSEPDQLLDRLVRESLFHASGNRRRLAGPVLGLSPYAPAVADCFLSLAGSDRELLGERAWDALWTIGHGTRRSDVVALADTDHPWTQRRALMSLARSATGLREEHHGVVRRCMDSAHSAVRRAALAATGLQAPEHLPTPLETQGHPEASVVRWWRKVGPALRDLDGRFDLEPLVD